MFLSGSNIFGAQDNLPADTVNLDGPDPLRSTLNEKFVIGNHVARSSDRSIASRTCWDQVIWRVVGWISVKMINLYSTGHRTPSRNPIQDFGAVVTGVRSRADLVEKNATMFTQHSRRWGNGVVRYMVYAIVRGFSGIFVNPTPSTLRGARR